MAGPLWCTRAEFTAPGRSSAPASPHRRALRLATSAHQKKVARASFQKLAILILDAAIALRSSTDFNRMRRIKRHWEHCLLRLGRGLGYAIRQGLGLAISLGLLQASQGFERKADYERCARWDLRGSSLGTRALTTNQVSQTWRAKPERQSLSALRGALLNYIERPRRSRKRRLAAH